MPTPTRPIVTHGSARRARFQHGFRLGHARCRTDGVLGAVVEERPPTGGYLQILEVIAPSRARGLGRGRRQGQG